MVPNLFSVVTFDGHRGDVLPFELSNHFDDGLRLKVVRWNDSTEIFKARLVR